MHPVILVTGASGGLGTSTLAAVTAAVLARGRTPTLVDADFGSGGLDTTLAVEHVDGLRWGDLAEHDGEVDADALRRGLPDAVVPVLGARGSVPSATAIRAVTTGLARLGPVVVDVPSGSQDPSVWSEVADVLVLLVGLRPRWLRDGEAFVAGRGGHSSLSERTLLVTRGPRRAERVARQAADHLGLPLLDHLADDPSVPREEANGRAPRPRGAVGDVARSIADSLPPPGSSVGHRVLGLAS